MEKLTVGWWKARDGSKWHVDWAGENIASGHAEDVEVVRIWDTNGKSHSSLDRGYDLIAEWKEPTYRPWTMDEVPIAWFRLKGDASSCFLSGRKDSEELQLFEKGWCSFDWFLKNYEHQPIGSSEWLPCGVRV